MIIVPQRVTAAGNKTRLTDFFDQFFFGSTMTNRAAELLEAMTSLQPSRAVRWQTILQQVEAAYRALDDAEKDWIRQQLRQIESLQLQLDRLFQQAGGSNACGGCQGDCCAKGHNHLTLANLLSYLQEGKLPPVADFSRTCPFLAEQGCLLPVASRPYNCVSFVCDIIENALAPAELAEFYRLEGELRSCYQQFAARYRGAGMTGLLLQQEQSPGSTFLEKK